MIIRTRLRHQLKNPNPDPRSPFQNYHNYWLLSTVQCWASYEWHGNNPQQATYRHDRRALQDVNVMWVAGRVRILTCVTKCVMYDKVKWLLISPVYLCKYSSEPSLRHSRPRDQWPTVTRECDLEWSGDSAGSVSCHDNCSITRQYYSLLIMLRPTYCQALAQNP